MDAAEELHPIPLGRTLLVEYLPICVNNNLYLVMHWKIKLGSRQCGFTLPTECGIPVLYMYKILHQGFQTLELCTQDDNPYLLMMVSRTIMLLQVYISHCLKEKTTNKGNSTHTLTLQLVSPLL